MQNRGPNVHTTIYKLTNPSLPHHNSLTEFFYTKSLRYCGLMILRGGLWAVLVLGCVVPCICWCNCGCWSITESLHVKDKTYKLRNTMTNNDIVVRIIEQQCH